MDPYQYTDTKIQEHTHNGTDATSVDFDDIFGTIKTVDDATDLTNRLNETPNTISDQIFVDITTAAKRLYTYDYAGRVWYHFNAIESFPLSTATIATTGNTDGYIIVPNQGNLVSVDFSGVDALAASDTNYITWSITNLGQTGSGSTAMLAATDANTTKATGGSAVSANTKRSLTVHGTAANLVVAAGDRLRIRAAVTGTLANTITFPAYIIRFN